MVNSREFGTGLDFENGFRIITVSLTSITSGEAILNRFLQFSRDYGRTARIKELLCLLNKAKHEKFFIGRQASYLDQYTTRLLHSQSTPTLANSRANSTLPSRENSLQDSIHQLEQLLCRSNRVIQDSANFYARALAKQPTFQEKCDTIYPWFQLMTWHSLFAIG